MDHLHHKYALNCHMVSFQIIVKLYTNSVAPKVTKTPEYLKMMKTSIDFRQKRKRKVRQ